MDIATMLKELRAEREQIDQAIAALVRLTASHGKRPGRPPNWLKEAAPKRRGRPPGSKNKPKPAAAKVA